MRACAIFPILPRGHRLEILRTITSPLRHLAELGCLYDFARFRDGQSFSARGYVNKFPDRPDSAPVGIFMRDHFRSSPFGLISVPMRFRVIPRWSIIMRALARAQFSLSFLERTGWKFHARSPPIFVIWPNYGTYAIP